jgi:hypothetical protein
VPYPTSCSPQAWASATPVQLVRTLLRFDPELPQERLWVDPVLPPAFAPLRVEGVALGSSRVSVEVTGEETLVEGVPSGVELRYEPRPLEDSYPA